MENVAKLACHQVFDEFLSALDKAKYEVTWDILDCRLYGIPQSRRRLVLIASKLGKPHLPAPTTPDVLQWKTVRQSIGDLPCIAAGEAHQLDPYHVSSSLSDTNLRRIKASKPGGTWRDWPIDLITPCHKKKSGKTYPAVYGRMEWDRPAPTMTGQCFGYGNGRFGHPEQDRAISLREAAILQSFPRQYAFASRKDEIYIKSAGLMIGNAVPPKLAETIGSAIVEHILNAH
jgi:DNA (cytosine-5)-methyltransferase 1